MQLFRRHIAQCLSERSEALATAWLQQVNERLSEEPHRLFPTRTLLNRIPQVLRRIAAAIGDDRGDARDSLIEKEVQDLAELRRSQGYRLDELTREFELLGNLFFETIVEESGRFEGTVAPTEMLAVARQVHRSFSELTRIAAASFADLRAQDRHQRADLLRRYSEALQHELRNGANAASLRIQLAREALDTGDSEAIRENIAAAAVAIQRLTARSIDSLAAASIQGKPMLSEEGRVGLDATLRAVVDGLRASYPAYRDVVIELHAPLETGPVAAEGLELALGLLIGAAVDATIRTRNGRPIGIRTSRRDAAIRVEVEHSGAIPRLDPDDGEVRAGGEVVAGVDGLPDVMVALARRAVEQFGGAVSGEHDGSGRRLVVSFSEPAEDLDEREIPQA